MRSLFERGAIRHFPTLKRAFASESVRYSLTVDVPEYESRKVTIDLGRYGCDFPKVTADGPTESPHRYGNGTLCMWRDTDPPAERWLFDDGLLMLIGLTIAHLFREAWWREHDEWLGPEHGHRKSEST